ncbi:MAG: hypothetical protein OES47_14700 [Acidobacteriota bacterium]|nr:hypothetical protein [Acidobacteriota bacterium]
MRTLNPTSTPILRRSCAIFAFALLFSLAAGAAVERTEIIATDDWPATSLLDPGVANCTIGDIVWLNEVTPTCPDGGTLRIRETLGYSCVQAASVKGAPEPRFTGVASFSLNANFDAGYSGRVWGVWQLVPSEACDPQLLADPQEFWEGRWQGRRAQVCSGDQCKWIGALKWLGRGRGGRIDRQRFKGTESVETFTPLPVAFELLGLCAPSAPCPAEGHLMGTIRKK